MAILTRTEIKEKIYSFLKKGVDGTWSKGQVDSNFQYNSIENMANDFSTNQQERKEIELLLLDVFNDIILNGIVAIKRGGEFFFITEKGKKFIRDQTFDIYDPDLYLKSLPQLDNVTLSYITESIHAFNRDLYMSAIITLGVASESLVLDIANELQGKINDRNLGGLLSGNTSKINQVINRIDNLCSSKRLPNYNYYKTALYSMTNLIRHFRNQFGHPTGQVANFNDAHALLTMFKKYSTMMVELKTEIANYTFPP